MSFMKHHLVSLITLALAVAPLAPAQTPKGATEKPRPILRRGATHPGAGRQAAGQLAASIDAGDAYATPSGPRQLLRLANAVAVCADCATPEFQTQLMRPGKALAGFKSSGRGRQGIAILKSVSPSTKQAGNDAARHTALLNSVRATAAGRSANPVFIDPATGLRLLATSELVVCLRAGTEAAPFFDGAGRQTRPLFGTEDQFVLTLPGATAEEVFDEVARLTARPEVSWAEPNFIMQAARDFTPNDPLLTDQWYLRNDGQFGGSTNAQVHAAGAWDITFGSSNVVIAILDDGVQIDHPDLAANIFTNPGEIPDNGRDDDGNGLIDDVHGWDFYANDNNPAPVHELDNHGTSLAGVVAGVGNNAIGISGAAPGSRMLPLKIITGEDGVEVTEVARVLYYAAGLNLQGQPVWRGADIINISLTFSKSFVMDAALQAAATKGRGGRGCAIFAAAGNSAGAWVPFEVAFEPGTEGEHTLRWEFAKDYVDELRIGADTVWLDNIVFPDGTVESFEGGGLPSGWRTGGDSAWQNVKDGVNGNHALTGWTGPGARSLRAGPIANNQTNWVEVTTFLDPGLLRFWVWTESEIGYYNTNGVYIYSDVFRFTVDGEELGMDEGVPILETNVAYPANHPSVFAVGASTDFDFSADYSQFGAALDFVAPSDGGNAAISTTDRTGSDGYNPNDSPDGDYAHDFGGTSSATPLAAGVAALALSANPYLSLNDLGALLRSTSDHIGGVFYDENGFNPFYGYGRLNAGQAVRLAQPNIIITVSAQPNPSFLGDRTTFSLTVTNVGTSLSGPLRITHDLPGTSLFESATPGPSARSGHQLIFNHPGLAAHAAFTVRVMVSNTTAGTNSSTASVMTDVIETTLEDNLSITSYAVVPFVSIGNATVGETDRGATNAVFSVSLSHPSPRAVTVRYAAVSGAATRGRDFAAASGLLRFAPGETNKAIVVRVLPDFLDEDDENFFVDLSAPVNAAIEAGRGIGRILDNDPQPAISISDASRVEGSAAAVFRVRLSKPSGRPVSVNFATASGSAVEGSYFTRTNGTLLFAPGRTLLTIPVRVRGDATHESNETFFINLSAPVSATLGDAQGVGTILNNDPAPRLFLSDATVAEGNDGATNMVFNVRLAPASGRPVQVSFFTTNGLATFGADYVATNGTLLFQPGETNQFITVPVLGDTLNESSETFSVRLVAPVNATLGDGLGKGTILNAPIVARPQEPASRRVGDRRSALSARDGR